MNTNEPDYFESNEDHVIENFDTLNDKYRNNSDWITNATTVGNDYEVTKEDLNPLVAFKSLYLPGQQATGELNFDTEYKEGISDPYQRILNLKYELIDCKTKIDIHASRFSDNQFIKEGEDIGNVLAELDLYKSKIDAFIDYGIYAKTTDDSGNASDDSISSTNFQSIFEKYTRLTENLITQVKQHEVGVLNNKGGNFNIKYEICANPQLQMESLIERVGELEEMMNNLENNIGIWDIVNVPLIL
jgi:hypothetical protein